jgi:hypothetical protein
VDFRRLRVDLVHWDSFVQPNKRDKPNKPNNGLLLLDLHGGWGERLGSSIEQLKAF